MFVQLQATRRPPAPPLRLVTIEAIAVRPARLADMGEVGPLIDGFATRGLMLPKSPEQLYRTFREFLVARDEADRLLGCVALRVYSPALAEVSALAVAAEAHGLGVGRRLMDALIGEARSLGLTTLFALTLEEGFFHRLGFRTVPRESFPQKIGADCAGCDRRMHCREITVAFEINERSNGGDGIHV